MRRNDREVTDLDEIIKIVDKCDVCRLAINSDDGYPYIVPLNFGYVSDGEKLILLFHSALEGRKHDLLRRDNHVSFEMDCEHSLLSVAERGYCTMNYESVIGHGYVEYITDESAKLEALTLMTDRYHCGRHFEYNTAAVSRTAVYRLVVEGLVGKRKASVR